MRCPACDQAMVILEYQGIELDHCVACGGCWLDAGELGLLLTGTLDAPGDVALARERAAGSERMAALSQHLGELFGGENNNPRENKT